MNKKPLFSIIIPTKNPNEEYFKECLDSVFKQTYTNYELIVVANNCEEDKINFIENEIKQFGDKVNLIITSEHGVSRARNIGIDNSNGDYIVFLDDDDLISPYFLKSSIESLEKEVADFVIFQYTNDESLLSQSIISNHIVLNKNDINDLFFGFKNEHGIETRSIWGKVFSTKIIKDNNIRYCPTLFIGEDTCFVLDYVSYCSNVAFLNNGNGYFYRTNSSSVTYKYNPDIINQFDIYFGEYKRILDRNNQNIFKLQYVLINQIIYNIFISYIFNKGNNQNIFKKSIEVRNLFKKDQYKSSLKAVNIKQLVGFKKKLVTFMFKIHLYFIPSLFLNRRYSK